jgi:hemerythrin-like domain-containing protein
MALAHNIMIRYLNSIYLQATGITQAKDIADFLFYCQSWCGVIHAHHSEEEKKLFPRMEAYTGEKGIMDDCVEEHKVFDTGIDNFEKYVRDAKPEEYDGKKLRTLIDDFAPALMKHLRQEIAKLIVVGEQFGGDKLYDTFDKFETELVKESRLQWDPVSFPFLLNSA